MNTDKSILSAIAELILGRKYWANIINTRGVIRPEISSRIFTSREAADRHRQELATTLSYEHVEIISFRSRHDYSDMTNQKI